MTDRPRSKHPVIAQARAWLDEDGLHVWVGHDCVTERVVSMLPHPTWQAVQLDGCLKAYPSVHCLACGLHGFLPIEPKEAS